MESQLWAIAIRGDRSAGELKSKVAELATVSPFKIPINQLRVGTLDSLMSLSDELMKMDTLAEATVSKMFKQLMDLKPDEEPTIIGGARSAPCRVPSTPTRPCTTVETKNLPWLPSAAQRAPGPQGLVHSSLTALMRPSLDAHGTPRPLLAAHPRLRAHLIGWHPHPSQCLWSPTPRCSGSGTRPSFSSNRRCAT
jgi:hypothetical protein